jgi:FkbM family methyltransferase
VFRIIVRLPVGLQYAVPDGLSPIWKLIAPLRALRRLLPAPTVASAADEQPSYIDTAEGRRIYLDPRDGRAAALIRAGGDFNPTTRRIWRTLCAERAWTHVIDVGANYGEMLLGAPLPVDAHIVALEPNPHLVPMLERTLREAGLNVEVLAVAASDVAGTAALTIDRDWSGMSSLVPQPETESHAKELRDVPAVTLAQIVRERAHGRVRLLTKIDVEGHEVAVLRGLEPLHGEVDDFAALIEVLHLNDADLDWIVARFDVALYESAHERLVPLDVPDGAALRAVLASGQYYPLDAVLRLKR